MTINNRGLSGQPILPYIDYRSYMGADIFIDLVFLDHTNTPINPSSVSYRIDDLTNAVPMLANTTLANTKASVQGTIGFTGTGSVTGDNLTVASVSNGIILPGDTAIIAGLPAGTTVLSQATGTIGGTGTYKLSQAVLNPISTTTLTTTSSNFYVTSVSYGALVVGDQIVNPQFTETINAFLQTPVAVLPVTGTLTGNLWNLQGTQVGPFTGGFTVTSSLPNSYTLQIPGSVMQMTHNWQGSQICQIWITTTWKDPITNQSSTAQGVAVVELCAVQTPNGAL